MPDALIPAAPAAPAFDADSLEGLPPASTKRILNKTFDVLRRVHPEPALLLDVPCGSGYMSVRAARAGWKVVPGDILPERFQGGGEFPIQYMDLLGKLPIDDASVDAITCCEGFEHLENPWNALREFRRVAKPGGLLLLSLPNTVDLRQRFRLLFRGQFGHYYPHIKGHVNPMGPFMLCHALLGNGFEIESIESPKIYGGLLFRMLRPFFRYRASCGLPDDVRAMLSHRRSLCARTLLVVARAPATTPS